MCKLGDIVVVEKYSDHGQSLGRHSFVVLNDESGTIQGLDYDIVCNVMSSFKDEEQRKKKLSYPGNFPVEFGESAIENGNSKSGYIKAEQFYYFSKTKTEFVVIGSLAEEILRALIEFIESLNIKFVHIIDNL